MCFFFKQKTAYELRISDWSSDVCSSDLERSAQPIIGRLVSRGLSDEHADRHYVIVDAIDGRSHYVDIGGHSEELTQNSIVRVTPRSVAVRKVDRTITEVAAAHGGRYSIDNHLSHDPTATERSEEHTSELQSLMRNSYAVFCLKKKKNTKSNR